MRVGIPRFSVNKTIQVLTMTMGLSMGMYAYAHDDKYTVDVYRSNQITAEDIQSKYKSELDELVKLQLSKDIFKMSNLEKMLNIEKHISDQMKQQGQFSYIDFSVVQYPNDKVPHVTVDVVDKNDEERLHYFVQEPNQNLHGAEDLLLVMNKYLEIGNTQIIKEKKFPTYKRCPVFHCTFGFEQKELKPYLSIFNKGVKKYESQLYNILKNDRNAEKRASAAYLLAHVKDGHKLVKNLSYSILDPNNSVRNNVLRVSGMALTKVKVDDYPMSDLIKTLDCPHETDRNKTLLVMTSLAKQNQKYRDYLIKYSSDLLLKNLRLSQPNLHHNAISVLQAISGKHFNENDYSSWEKWVKQAKLNLK